jgi:DNA-directed RNA polymerase specialized sigma subunit
MIDLKTFTDHLGIVGRQSNCFVPNNVSDRSDYFQVGAISLLKAMNKHNPEKSKLTTYAWPIIYRDIKRFQTKSSRKVVVSESDIYNIPEDFWESVPDNLTIEEKACIQMKLEGYNNKDIAKKLKLKFSEVEFVFGSAVAKIRKANEES